MSRKCIVCGVEIDPRRIAILPNTQTCTQHSTVEKKAAVTVQMGEGDHTWIETYAVDREDLRKIEEAEKNFRKQLIEDENPIESISTDVDDDTKTLNDFDLEEDATEPDIDHA
jgi:adenine-specific DNA methylase